MSKKDKKIEIRLEDKQVTVNGVSVTGYQLLAGKKVIGEIAELDGKFATIKDASVDTFFRKLDLAIENSIENYNLNH